MYKRISFRRTSPHRGLHSALGRVTSGCVTSGRVTSGRVALGRARLRLRSSFSPLRSDPAGHDSSGPRRGARSLWRACICAAILGALLVTVVEAGSPTSPWLTADLTGIDPNNSHPYGVVISPSTALAYVALSGLPDFATPELVNGRTVVELSLADLSVVRTFDVGLFPTDLAIRADGSELFTVTSTDGALVRVDVSTGGVTTVPIVDSTGAAVSFPTGIALSADEQQLFVTSNGGGFDGSDENLLVYDSNTLALLQAVPVAGGLSRIAVRGDGLVVVPVGFPDDVFPSAPDVRVYDSTAGWPELARLVLPVDIADFPAPADVVLSEDGATAYVSVLGGSSAIYRVDVDAMQLGPALELSLVDFAQHGLAWDGAGNLLVSDFFANQVRRVDSETGVVLETLTCGENPNAIAVGGGRVLITNQGDETLTVALEPGSYVRGDVGGDGLLDLSDAVALLDDLFGGGALACPDRADVNDDGAVDVADPVALLAYLFTGGAPPAYPFPGPGLDLTPDGIDCP